MKVLTANIDVGAYTFSTVNEVVIEKSIDVLGSTASIKVPVSARLQGERVKTTAVDAAKQFNPGDYVTIRLGYDGDNREEFFGFVKRVNFTTPVEIECEDWTYMLRKRQYKKSWKKTTLKEVLNYLVSGTGVDLNANIPDIEFENFQIDANGADALQKIKDEYGLTIYFFEGELYAGLAYAIRRGDVKYRLRYNVIKDDDLKYRRAEDVQISVSAVSIKKDNTKIEATVGDPSGEKRTLYFYDVKDVKQLETLAKEKLDRYKYDGYEGKITAFLQPYADIAYIAQIEDANYPERSGSYYVESVKVEYGQSGARRTVGLAIKV